MFMGKRIGRELFYFFMGANLISWLFWVPALLKSAGFGLSLLNDFLVKVGDFIPSLLAVVQDVTGTGLLTKY